MVRPVLLLILAIALYFGFEPLTKRILPKLKTHWVSKTEQTRLASFEKPEMAATPPEKKGAITSLNNPGYVLKASADSSRWTLECLNPQSNSCLEALAERRGKLADWVAKTLAEFEDANASPKQAMPKKTAWKAEWNQAVDSGMPEFELTSLVRLSLTRPSHTGKKIQSWKPKHTPNGWNLCPEKGCPPSTPLRYPVDTTRQGKAVQTDSKRIQVRGKTSLLAPSSGWIASLDTVDGAVRIAMDHAGMARTICYGNIKVNQRIQPGHFIRQGMTLATLTGEMDTATITFYRMGRPVLPIEWKSHAP